MENNKNMTAVEWFYDKLENHEIQANHYELFQQAKQMEKEQIIQFSDEYADAVMGGCINRAEQYYKETYGKN